MDYVALMRSDKVLDTTQFYKVGWGKLRSSASFIIIEYVKWIPG